MGPHHKLRAAAIKLPQTLADDINLGLIYDDTMGVSVAIDILHLWGWFDRTGLHAHLKTAVTPTA